MNIEELQRSLVGCPHVNLPQIAKEYFTQDLLESYADSLGSAIQMSEGLGIPIEYNPTELDKCIVHYCSRNVIDDLWKFSMPTIQRFVDSKGRFKLEEALGSGDYGSLTEDMAHNLNIGKEFFFNTTADLYEDWLQDLKQRRNMDPNDLIPLQYAIYKQHSVLINEGDWSAHSIMANTFTSAGRENFDWVAGYPNMTREELEEIAANSVEEGITQATQLGIKSAAKEQVVREVTERGDLAYILDPDGKRIIFNPKHSEEVVQREKELEESYYDQTQLQLNCPAKYVPSSLYPAGGMLHDLDKFRQSMYVEIYLATHNRS